MADRSDPSVLDCLVVGAGPAGLTAALYLARFRRSALTVDGGHSRAALIPVTHNCPGFPQGIPGAALLERLRAQARRYGAVLRPGQVSALAREDGLYSARVGDQTLRARRVVLATGVVDVEPALPDLEGAVRRGYLRHCPVCDAYESIDRRVGVIACDGHGVGEALFLRHYTADLTVLTLGVELPEELRRRLAAAGIRLVEEPVTAIHLVEERIAALRYYSGIDETFDTLYSALGTAVRSELACALGADHSDDGELRVDAHQQTSVPGLYAAGDVCHALNQIAVAEGQAAIAATAIHNGL